MESSKTFKKEIDAAHVHKISFDYSSTPPRRSQLIFSNKSSPQELAGVQYFKDTLAR